MPSKLPFTAERAEQLGALSAEKAALALRDEQTVTQHELSCSYRGSRAADGSVDATAELTAKSTLVYEWHVKGAGVDEQHEKSVNAKDAEKQGVPLPAAWKTALRCGDLSTLIAPAVDAAREGSGIADVNCMCVGAARSATLAASEAVQPGATVVLGSGGARIAYILCACVREGEWLCHRGTLDHDGAVERLDPFNEQNLVPCNLISHELNSFFIPVR